jgi:hypothetical protein
MIKWLAISGASALCFVTVWVADAPAQQQTVALICRGPLLTFRTDGGKTITTPFKWAKDAASKEQPGAGECAWTDRTPQPTEVKEGKDNVVRGNLGPFDNLPVGTFGKFCVNRATNDMMVRSFVRGSGQNAPFVLPPFNNDGCPA